MNKETLRLVLKSQKSEITEHFIYKKLARKTKDKRNKKILLHLSKDELRHYNYWKRISKKELKPNSLKVFFYVLFAQLFGLAFTLKLMESGETNSQSFYRRLSKFSGVKRIIHDEKVHEKNILDMLKEERIEYASSTVLGLNDALVELTGALAGLTLALQNNTIIAVTGLIIGIAASLSMAASEFLSSKEEKSKSPLKSAIYTGIAYIITVFLLISPYLLLSNVYISLALMLIIGIFIVATYTFYMSVAKNLKFWPKFLQMVFISLTVAIISFGIGLLVRFYFGIEV